MEELRRIKAQQKINKQAIGIQMPAAFTDKFPDLKPAKAQKLFDKYISVVSAIIAKQVPWIVDGLCNVSLDEIDRKCGSFEVKKKRYYLWAELRELYPLFKIVQKGNNLIGKNTIVEMNDSIIKKLLNHMTDEKLVDAMFADVPSDVTPELVPIDLANLQNYIDNCTYDLAHNAINKGDSWADKVRRNQNQAMIVLRVARYLDGSFPQYPKASVFGRTYYYSLSIQSMSKQVRSAVLGEHFQYDMSAAIYGIKLAILSGIVGSPKERHPENRLIGYFSYTKEYLQEKDAIRKRLAAECMTDAAISFESKLKSVKLAITAIGFGAKTDAHVWSSQDLPALHEIIKNKADRERFLNDRFVKHFVAEQEEITEIIVNYLKGNGQFEVIKAEIKKSKADMRVTEAHVLAYLFQHYETELMDIAAEKAQKQTPVLARIHDAFITGEKLSQTIMDEIDEEFATAHSLIKLDVEKVQTWQSVDQRKRVDDAKAFEAEHKARIAEEERAARAFYGHQA